jgi:hypothetical protein
VGADISSFYKFTPSLSANYLIQLTNLQDTTGTWGVTMDLYSAAGYVSTLGYCSSRSYYTTYTGDVICPISNFSSLPTLSAGTPYYVQLHNNEFYTANTYSIDVTPFAPSLGCNSGGTACYNFETGIPGSFTNNPTTLPYASDSGWTLDTGIGRSELSVNQAERQRNHLPQLLLVQRGEREMDRVQREGADDGVRFT